MEPRRLLLKLTSQSCVVWTDSWLSIAGAGCGLTSVGAGEEQAQKVIASEAYRCGEDK
jgi:hypothetical protein